MNRTLFGAALIALLTTSAVQAQDPMVDPSQDASAESVMQCCCYDSGAWIVGVEATFMKFFDSNGVEDFLGSDAEFDYEVSPRLTFGFVGCDGMGARVRYWEYDQSATSGLANNVSVDTYLIDFEVFQNVELGCCTSIELSGGLRYNEFRMNREPAGPTDRFRGIGGMLAVEGNRQLNCNWSVYGRARQIILTDDFFASAFVFGSDENDGIRDVTEVALGVQYHSCNWSIHAGYEWHLWSNYTSNHFLNADGETSDIGFSGFVVGATLNY